MGRVFYTNGEGYADSTAGKALQNVNRERRRMEIDVAAIIDKIGDIRANLQSRLEVLNG